MFVLQESLWGQQCLLWLHQLMQYRFFVVMFPVLADALVLLYPLYLIILYVYGMYISRKQKAASGKLSTISSLALSLKESAVWIFCATFVSAVTTIVIQLFLVKARPDTVLNLIFQQKREILLHQYIPSPSFPSDHATVAMSIAVATLLWGLRYKKKGYVYFSFVLFVISGIMSWARISIGLHWPTDVLGGFFVGIIVPVLLFRGKIYQFLKKFVIDVVIRIQEKIVGF